MGRKNEKRISDWELFDGVMGIACKLSRLPDIPYAVLCDYDGRDNEVNAYSECD